MFFAPLGPVEACVTCVTEIPETAFEEMFGAEMSDRTVIGFEPGEGRDEARGADIDHRHFERAERFGNGGIFDAGDNAGAVPGGEPGGGFVAAGVFGEVDGPGASFADVADDAAEKTAGISVGGLDEKGDFWVGFQGRASGWEERTLQNFRSNARKIMA